METGSPERLEWLKSQIRRAKEKEKRAAAAGDGMESCRQKGNIAVWRHAIEREYYGRS